MRARATASLLTDCRRPSLISTMRMRAQDSTTLDTQPGYGLISEMTISRSIARDNVGDFFRGYGLETDGAIPSIIAAQQALTARTDSANVRACPTAVVSGLSATVTGSRRGAQLTAVATKETRSSGIACGPTRGRTRLRLCGYCTTASDSLGTCSRLARGKRCARGERLS